MDENPGGPGFHDEPHRPVEAWPIDAAFAVVFEVSVSARHARLVLVGGEGGPAELLSCLESDEPVTDPCGWGFAGGGVASAAAHAAWHAVTGTPPGGCDAELVEDRQLPAGGSEP